MPLVAVDKELVHSSDYATTKDIEGLKEDREKCRFSFSKVDVLISHSTDFISQRADFISQSTEFHFAKYRFYFVSFTISPPGTRIVKIGALLLWQFVL